MKINFLCKNNHELLLSYNDMMNIVINDQTYCTKCNEKVNKDFDFDNLEKHKKAERVTKEDYENAAQKRNGHFIDEQIPANVDTKSKFICENNHVFSATYSWVIRGCWCPECVGLKRKTKDDYNTLASIKDGFFIANDIPQNVISKTQWKCKVGHIFEMTYSKIQRGQWCQFCYAKTETKIYTEINNRGYICKKRFNVDWCKNLVTNYYLYYDLVIPLQMENDVIKKGIIVEVDGAQHFRQVRNWNSPGFNMKRDVYKMIKAIKNNFMIIRITQEDVWYEKHEWRTEFFNILDNREWYNEPLYINNEINNGIYNKHIELFNLFFDKDENQLKTLLENNEEDEDSSNEEDEDSSNEEDEDSSNEEDEDSSNEEDEDPKIETLTITNEKSIQIQLNKLKSKLVII
jgi:hypothetical protein